MKALKVVGFILLIGALWMVGPETGKRSTTTGNVILISEAQARVGRPLTPVSVAGVARRTTRRTVARTTY